MNMYPSQSRRRWCGGDGWRRGDDGSGLAGVGGGCDDDGGGFGGGVMLLAAWSGSRGGREVVTTAVGGGWPENGRSGAGKPKGGRRWWLGFGIK
ncbi:hypothetical protein Tco_0891849 [Tanacetum coccineum]|uniref:Uncharacterized protein n=1 Tax=Tanacetum coccineum TaxID=301880 RepID=A0ABQ5C777_9ASTR